MLKISKNYTDSVGKLTISCMSIALLLSTGILADNWTTSSSGKIYSGSTTKVGIGTSSPAYKLDVKGTTACTSIVAKKYVPISSYSDAAVFGYNSSSGSGAYTCGLSGEASGASGITYSVGLRAYGYSGQYAIGGYFQSSGGVRNSINICSGWGTIPAGNWAATLFGNTYISGDLQIDGKIKIKTWAIEAPDYVFLRDYKLLNLNDVEKFIEKNKHLPDVPSAAEMKEKGVDMAEMNMTLLKKVEELTLYVIEQNKKIERLEKKITQE